MNTLTDDQGNKWKFVEFFSHEEQIYLYALQPVPLKEGETWKETDQETIDYGGGNRG